MKGVLLVSHGGMAEGLLDSLSMFYSIDVESVDFLSLTTDNGPDAFKNELEGKIEKLKTEEGLIIFADLFGGTPANLSSFYADDSVEIITGMNLSMLLDYFSRRETNVSTDEIIDSGRQGIVCINDILKKRKVKGE